MQTCIWLSCCHCHSLSLASVKSRLVLPFWYQLTRVVPEKGPLNGCVCVSVCVVLPVILTLCVTHPNCKVCLLHFNHQNCHCTFQTLCECIIVLALSPTGNVLTACKLQSMCNALSRGMHHHCNSQSHISNFNDFYARSLISF